MSNCNGRLEECSATTSFEYLNGECAKCKDNMLLPAVWYEDRLWVKVPGYKTFYTCVTTGEQKLISMEES